MLRRFAVVAVAVLGLVVFAASAQADTTNIIQPQNETFDQGFQAITCTQEAEAGAPPEGPPPKYCSPETPNIFSTIAGGHPPIGFTQYIIQHAKYTLIPGPGFLAPIPPTVASHSIKTLRTDLPPGLTVNPEATPSRCPLANFLNKVGENYVPTCAASTQTGEENISLVTNRNEVEIKEGVKVPEGFFIPPQPGGTKVPVYNLVPAEGEPAKFGFVVNGKIPVFLETQVAWESDFHESFTIKLPYTAELTGLSTLISRLVSFGSKVTEGSNGTFITNPTTCFNPNEAQYEHLYSTWFRAESYGEPNPTFPEGSTAVEAKFPKGASGERVQQSGCDTIPFEPSIEVNPGTSSIDSPAGATVEAKLPFDPAKEGGAGQSQSNVKKAEISLPAGMGLNPSGANGLEACTDAQFKKGVRTENNECPASSNVGTVEVVSPPLAEPLVGNVYVGEQKSMSPESGEEFRILIEAKSKKEGIVARLVGNVKANATTGQLTAVLNDQLTGQFAGQLPEGLPQVPFESVRIRFNGSKDVLTSPPTCATAEANGQMEPWARPGTNTAVSAKFTLSTDPRGGSCPTSLGERKFTPVLVGKSDNTQADTYSPFRVTIARSDGEQELKAVDITLPEGLTGKLAGIPYCSEANIDAAGKRSGKATQAEYTCGPNSLLGTATVEAGTGGNPLKISGKAFLAGPYKGAPFSLVVITPAVAGPFDLGTVVVRTALNVDPTTAQVNAVSDPIPDVFGGVKLDIRNIDVNIDRSKFMLSPTSCAKAATEGVINGGGSNPANAGSWSSFDVSSQYRVSGCNKLGFQPKLHVRIYGPTTRAKNTRIRAILEAKNGNANIARTALNLPHSLFLDQGHIRTVCTRVQLAAKQCPKAAIYGHAQAKSPLVSRALKGPVYLVSSNDKLPNLVADLRGQVNIQLRGVISSKHGGLKTVFPEVPDVPVTKFILNMQGGKKSLIENSENLCKSPQRAILNLKGYNGKKVKTNKFPLRIDKCGNGKKKNKKGNK
ncbi:MAG: hypothetical protein AB7V58_08950 [Solirubrobacterales bacterium]